MDLEGKARATLQELLDVVKGYREAAERTELEASRIRLQCEAWRSRALEEQRRSARLRRMLSNGVHVTSKSHVPSLQNSPKQGLLDAFSEEEILYQFGSLLALVITLSAPAAASTPKAGSKTPGPFYEEPCSSGYPTKSTAAAAAAAAALTAFAAGPRPPGRQEPTAASGTPTGGGDSGLLIAAQGYLHGNRAKSQGEIGVLSAAGSGGSAGYGGGDGGDLGQALSSSSSLSSLAAGSGNCVAAPGRSHSRAGFKLVVRGGNGDSTSLRQLTNYGAMYPAAATPGSISTHSASCTATRALPSRTSSRATGLGVIAPPHYHGGVHESYSACELTRAGGGDVGEANGAGDGDGGGASSRQARTATVRPTRAASVSGMARGRDADGHLPLMAPGAASPSPSLEKGSSRRAVQGTVAERVAEPSGPGPSSPVVHAGTSAVVRSKSQPPMLAETAHVAVAAISGSSSPDGGAMAERGGGGASSSAVAANTAAAAAAGASPQVRTPGDGSEQAAISQDDGVEVGLRTSVSEPGPQPDIEREGPGDDTSHNAPPPAGPATSRTLARGSAPGPFLGAAEPASVATLNNGASPAATAAHAMPEQESSSETPPTLRARSTAFNQDLRHAVLHTSVGPVARTLSATRGSGLGRTSLSLTPAVIAPSTVPRRETVPAVLQSPVRKSAAKMSSPPAVHSDDLSWHAGSLHKQLVKLQDDLNSIQQSSALIRSNRATCNLAPSSPRHSAQPSPPPGSGAAGSAVPRRDTSVALGNTPPPQQGGTLASPFSGTAVNAATETARDSGAGGGGAGGNLSCLLPARAHSGPTIATSSLPTSNIPPSTASVPVNSIPIDDATIATAPSVDAVPPQPPPPPSVSDPPSSPVPTSPPLTRPDPTASPPPAHRPPTAPECNTCSAMSPDPAFVALYWVKRPAAALVVAKPSPAVRPTFTRVISWLHANGVSTYVEPSLLRNGFSLPPGGGGGATAAANDSSWRILTAGDTDGDGDAEGWSDAWADAEAAAAGPMPGCAIGFPRVLSWPAEEGNDCHSQMVPSDVAAAIDFVVVLGGDGTVLWTCHIFGNQSVPPVLPFNLGSLGFLTPFDPEAAEAALQHVMEGGFPIMLRHRLHCHIVRASQVRCTAGGTDRDAEGGKGKSRVCQSSDEDSGGGGGGGGPSREWVVLNEVVIDRGISSFLTNLECYCDGTFVTHVQGDGLIVATPTGSTAYNLAAGGSMVHPQVPGILFTPICPHSLSFRPLIFPDHVSLCIQVPANSRAQMWCSFDGKDRQALSAGDAVVIRMSAWPVPTVCSRDASRDWFSGVREGLHWNMRRLQAGAGQ